MKEIIDIPVGNYEYCQKLVKDKQGNFFDIAVAGGICLNDLTNGEVFQKIFNIPDEDIDVGHAMVFVYAKHMLPGHLMNDLRFDIDWWNAKWSDEK